MKYITFPLKLKMFYKIGSVFAVKYYYSGMLDGLLGKKGISIKRFDKGTNMKQFILTIDYELFLGEETGGIYACMIEPTKKLASILEKNGSKMTIFWDILHYYRLLEIENENPKLIQRRQLIEEQVLDLAGKGHDIQLHIHPHWLDAKYEDNNWNFDYNRFSLHNLSDEKNPNDINTVTGCISISKKLIEDLIRKVKPNHIVNTFRAGGYLIEPFDKLKNAFSENEINVDSSVCPGLYNPNGISSYDFRLYPNKNKYNFDSTPKVISNDGKFIEIPITSIQLPWLRNIFYRFVKRIKYSNLDLERKGKGIGESYRVNEETDHVNKSANRLFSSQSTQLTTDSNFRQKFDYIYKKAPEYSTMILHPKLLNSHTLDLLDEYVSSNKIRFISIQDFVTKKMKTAEY